MTIDSVEKITVRDVMPKAVLLLHRRRYYDDGAISELKLWMLPGPVLGSAHRFKYSLFYGYPGRRAIGYDNERGKGDHRHWDDVETPYRFTSLEELLADFKADVDTLRRKESKDG